MKFHKNVSSMLVILVIFAEFLHNTVSYYLDTINKVGRWVGRLEGSVSYEHFLSQALRSQYDIKMFYENYI